ncbi:MAG: hypothetical protein ACTSRE_14205 [Promethearchaeota archaeon]
MKVAVSNSSPLILLGKIDSLNLLFNLFDEVYIPPAVFEEVVTRGIEENYTDASRVNEYIKKNKIQVKKPEKSDFMINSFNLHFGEIQVIELALSFQKKHIILLDEEEAREFAQGLGLRVKGTLGILIDNYLKKFIDSTSAVQKLNELNRMMYLSADLYSKVLENIK